MPRGWLKHESRTVGRKASRGGSSHRSNDNSSKQRNRLQNDVICSLVEEEYVYEEYDDTFLEQDQIQMHDDYRTTSKSINDEKECPICCETRPLISLMKKCNHPPACRECLHEIYVSQAQENVSKYPLKCYHPECSKPILASQLMHHDIFYTEEELQKHHRFCTLAKAYSNANTRMIVHCPDCDFPKLVTNQEKVNCKRCKTKFEIKYTDTNQTKHKKMTTLKHDKKSTIQALEALDKDEKGFNYGWTKCPACKMIVSKGNGCNHMTCVCGKEFYWDEVTVHGGPKDQFRPKLQMVVAGRPSEFPKVAK